MSYDLLEGVRVVELAMYAFAPSAAAVLSDWGADVVKVVPPKTADPMAGTPIAGLPEPTVDIAFMWEIMNRGKRCIGVDVATDDGRQVVLDLAAGSDVFITNLLPEARARFGVDVEDVVARRPDVIYARASGHGADGPERDAGGFDHTDFWARTGMAHAASQVAGEFVPQLGPALGDLTAGAFLAGGIAAALVRRARTGRGGVVDVSLLSSGMWVFAPSVVASQVHDVDTIPRARHADLPNPLVAGYTTKDGRTVYLAGIQTERHFATAEQRAANARACIEELDKVFAARDLATWRQILEGLSTPWTVVQTAREAAADAQVAANRMLVEVQGQGEGTAGAYPLVASPARFDGAAPDLRPAPQHGEQTEEILLELGRGWDEIAALKDSGAVL
jgi:crotonobetainyl-CoA:carnitine CoA-transferase CaiB-like acyl-CoA transferase